VVHIKINKIISAKRLILMILSENKMKSIALLHIKDCYENCRFWVRNL